MEPRHTHHHSFLGAIILITAGAILLLNNFGLVPSDIWSQIWRFWPFILILLGTQVMLRNSPARESVLIIIGLVFIALVIFYTLAISNPAVHTWMLQNLPWLRLPTNNPAFGNFNDNLNILY